MSELFQGRFRERKQHGSTISRPFFPSTVYCISESLGRESLKGRGKWWEFVGSRKTLVVLKEEELMPIYEKEKMANLP